MKPYERIIVALDVEPDYVRVLVNDLKDHVGMFKVGLRALMAIGLPTLTTWIPPEKLFVDGKFHDIPNTMSDAAYECARFGVKFINVHASAGMKAMNGVVQRLEKAQQDWGMKDKKTEVFAVTYLTSLSDRECQDHYSTEKRAGSGEIGVESLQ